MLLSCLYEVYQLASYYEQDQTHLMIPLKGVLLKGLRDYNFFGVKDEHMRSRSRIMSYAFLDGFGISSILKECLKLWVGVNSVS